MYLASPKSAILTSPLLLSKIFAPKSTNYQKFQRGNRKKNKGGFFQFENSLFTFEISMNDFLRMNILHSFQNLFDYAFQLRGC